MDGNKKEDRHVSQSIVANIQLGLPATVSKLSSKMRFIDKTAPMLKEAGIIRNIELIKPLNIRACGIATSSRTTNALGGILYVAGAVRQDVLIENGTIYKTRQESTVELDEIDDLDIQKKLKYINIINTYKLLYELMEDTEKPELVMVDTPLLLERADAPLDDRVDVKKIYDRCKTAIKDFWMKHKENIYPYKENGVKVVSIGNKRFGAVIFALTEDKIQFIPDNINKNMVGKITDEKYMNKLKNVGIKRLLHGVLVKCTRTAAFQFDGINKDSRLEPEELSHLGLMGMHIKAGNSTPPLLIEMLGTINDWSTDMLDELAAQVMTLITFDQSKAKPLPLWYAEYALRPIEVRPGVLEYYKAEAKQMLREQELENVWKEGFDVFEE
ncbi:hypothetical protein [Clostridium sporogenes]|uniref:NurA domain-containing protein n=1 Tax=Clostridium sporogenes TaxID=1509 RepID=A0A7U4JPB2_CLOSG|nr:hypothetical protein [Clostridium sporogenes]AKC62815.1 hypothetical protein CLSPO_c20950 [Clostridium sporogenes]AKJ90066.1 hypothetical protein CLSPOx_10550 [Clostridium sporogenes]KCZ68193.1 hypothetical protein CSPO_6c02360 [Clostridium sporogenes]KOY64365.1 hypothetical protein AN649_18775 [Clostridium sporogenes]OOO65329.1 hypothetical protein BS099_15695 [Clostridium sporogenes]